MMTMTPLGVIASSDSTPAEPPPGGGPTPAITSSAHYWTLDNLGVDFADTGTNSTDTGLWYFERKGTESNPGFSLRLDDTGNAFDHTGSIRTDQLEPLQFNSVNWTDPRQPSNLSGDFTVEIVFRQAGFGVQWGMTCHMIGTFILGFDNLDGGGAIQPTFQLLNPKGSDSQSGGPVSFQYQTDRIQSQSDYTNFVIKDARSSTTAIVDNTYHLLGTFEASTRTMKLYVDGVLEDTQTLTAGEYSSFLNGDDADPQKVLSKLDRYKRDRIYITPNRSLDSLPYTNGGYSDDLRIHQGVYMDDAQAAAQASIFRLGASLG